MLRLSTNLLKASANTSAKQTPTVEMRGEFSTRQQPGPNPAPSKGLISPNSRASPNAGQSALRVSPSSIINSARPDSRVGELLQQHSELMRRAREIEETMKDIRKYGEEGQWNALYSGVWAVALTVADVARHTLSIIYRSANKQFEEQDKAIEKLNKFLKITGKPLPTKQDALKNLDNDTARRLAEYSKDVREAKEKLQKSFHIKTTRKEEHFINAILDALDDCALILQSHSQYKEVGNRTRSTTDQVRVFLIRVQSKMQKVEVEIAKLAKQEAELEQARLLEIAMLKARTA